ncbi:MAG: CopG family transcriptional regulator [Halobaculum sp.]|jgi:hypothetical protein
MGKKDKTISFRVNRDAFDSLQEIADERDCSLSAVFRDYVDTLVEHDGRVEVVPEHVAEEPATDESEPTFPPTVTVPKSFVREHERLELEADHLREQLEEYRRYVAHLHDQVDDTDEEDVVYLGDLDSDGDGFDHEEFDLDTDEPYHLG